MEGTNSTFRANRVLSQHNTLPLPMFCLLPPFSFLFTVLFYLLFCYFCIIFLFRLANIVLSYFKFSRKSINTNTVQFFILNLIHFSGYQQKGLFHISFKVFFTLYVV